MSHTVKKYITLNFDALALRVMARRYVIPDNLYVIILISFQVLKYEDELMSLLHLLHSKALSKRGFSWTGKLLSSLMLTLTHTYPLENKFINPKEWSSEGRPLPSTVMSIKFTLQSQTSGEIIISTGANYLALTRLRSVTIFRQSRYLTRLSYHGMFQMTQS